MNVENKIAKNASGKYLAQLPALLIIERDFPIRTSLFDKILAGNKRLV